MKWQCYNFLSLEIIVDEFLAYKLHIFLTLDPTQPDQPKTENIVTQPDSWIDPTHVQLCVGVTGGISGGRFVPDMAMGWIHPWVGLGPKFSPMK